MTPVHLDKKANTDKMVASIGEAAGQGARLIVFPELIITGYVGPISPKEYQDFYQASEPIPGPTTNLFSEIAGKNNVHIVIGMVEKGESKLGPVMYNVAVLFGPKGFIGIHRKSHLPVVEKNYWLPGNEIEVFDTQLGRISLFVCYEFWFPETVRVAGLKGAQIIIDIANWPAFDTDPWFALGPGVAAANMAWFIGVNRVGGEDYWPGMGGSMIVNPSGKIITRGSDKEGIFYGYVDLTEIMKRRSFPPVWFDRRPELYESILKK
jgi:predicted amidohydrolase